MRTLIAFLLACAMLLPACGPSGNGSVATRRGGAVYYVDIQAPGASDSNPGTAAAPWKSISRAGGAKELQPGDTVRIRAGVYRESVKITVSGEPDRPITFEAAPGEKVVIKGSELIRGEWEDVSKATDVKEPFPNAFNRVYRIKLGKEYFTDPEFSGQYRDKSQWFVSQVFRADGKPLQKIGDDEIYRGREYPMINTVGRGLADLITDSFYYDAATQYLYIRAGVRPRWFKWFPMEIGVRGTVLRVDKAHDVIVRGLDCRHNRMPIGQWSMCGVGESRRVRLENCTFTLADFCGLCVASSKDCVVSNCDASYNGNTGITLHVTEDCVVENSRMAFNNYRRFSSGWHAGGMKSIPSNVRSIIRGCEAAYNIDSPGIWFDGDNADIQVIGNVVHDNGGEGIFYEINQGKGKPEGFRHNRGGGVIADNLVFANAFRGIYTSGSSGIYVVHNTVADNVTGITVQSRGEPFGANNNRVFNNLLIHNCIPADTLELGADLMISIHPAAQQATSGNSSDYNVYANNGWTPSMREEWQGDGLTLADWQRKFGMDLHSRLMPVLYETVRGGFYLKTATELDVAGPLPPGCPWKPANPRRVGASITRWP